MIELLFGKEAVERARKRGRAYMCVGCHTLTGERRIGEAGPMQDHVLKYHVSQDQVPYYCRLCMYRCQTRGQMEHHVRHNAKHVAMATSRGVTNHEEWQVESPVPYRVGALLRHLIRGSSPFPKKTCRMAHSLFLDNGVADSLAS